MIIMQKSLILAVTCTFVLLLAMSSAQAQFMDFRSAGWQNCEEVDINFEDGNPMANLLVLDMNVTGLTYGNIDEVELSNSECWEDGAIIPIQIWDNSGGAVANGSKWVDIMFQDDFTANTTYSLYHNKTTAPNPQRTNVTSRLNLKDPTQFYPVNIFACNVANSKTSIVGDYMLFESSGSGGSGVVCAWRVLHNETSKMLNFSTDDFNTQWIHGYQNNTGLHHNGDVRLADNLGISPFTYYMKSWTDWQPTPSWRSYGNDSAYTTDFWITQIMQQQNSTNATYVAEPKYLFLDYFLFCQDCNVTDELTYNVESVVLETNTSIPAVRFNVSDFDFASSTYVTAANESFNTTASEATMLLVTSFNAKAETGNETRDVYARVIMDGTELIDEKVRTISGDADEGSTGIDPLLFNVTTGEHYIQVDFRRTGNDSVEINDIDMVLVKVNATGDAELRYNLTQVDYSHDDTSFAPEFQWTVDTFYFGKFSMSANATAVGTYYFENLNTSDTSPLWQRYLSDSGDTGSVSMVWYEEINQTYTHAIQSKSDGANITVSGSIVEFDTTTNDGQNVNAFQTSNPSTDIDNYLAYTEGSHNIANATITNYIGDSYFVGAVVTYNASAESTPAIHINSSSLSQANCYSKKERYLSGTSDIANVYIYTICEGLTNTSYTFNLWLDVPANVTVNLLDESLAGFEATEFSIAEGYLPPIPNSITSPSSGQRVKDTINVTWLSFADPNDDLSYYNISLLNSDDSFNQTIAGSVSVLYQTFDTTTIEDGTYKAQVEAVDAQNLSSSSNLQFIIDNTVPIVTITSPDNVTEYPSSTVTLTFSSDDIIASAWYNLNSGGNVTITGNVTSLPITGVEGINDVTVYVTDLASNEGSLSVNFTVGTYIDDRVMAGAVLIVIMLMFALANLVLRLI